MKFTKGGNCNMTSLQGYIRASYDQLVAVFGEPEYGPDDTGGDKVTCEWVISFEDGTVATIYDWKEYNTPYHMYDWHIGGKSKEAVWAVTEAFQMVKA